MKEQLLYLYSKYKQDIKEHNQKYHRMKENHVLSFEDFMFWLEENYIDCPLI